ncbi:MAG: amidohydrolase family protein [Planctomycetes bacterium]|nr:amidohydrolase family protein [Planctomycetota bacterium]
MKLPGFVDLQVNGYGGVNFGLPEVTPREILVTAEILRSRGTAGILATIVTNTRETIEHAVLAIVQAMKEQGPDGAILGIHLEGPFLSAEYGYRGAHPEECMIPPDAGWFNKLQALAEGHIRILTIAPEVEGTAEFIRKIDPEVIVSAGHSAAPYAPLREAVEAGLSMVTHFGNGCRTEINRHDNPLVNLLACPELTFGFIPDGHHLPEAFLRMIAARIPVDKMFAVSDSIHFAGLEPGVYPSNVGEARLMESGKLCMEADHNLLFGSSATLLECMNHLASLRIFSEDELFQIGYENPLRLLGIDPEEFSAKRKPTITYVPQSHCFKQF